MARIRTIKPEFFTSEQIVDCSVSARLLFAGMWCFCDDQGVHPASVKRLKMEVFPADPFTDDEIGGMVDELKAKGLIGEFVHENQTFWYVTGWQKHQKIERPTKRHPTPPNQKIDDPSPSDHRAVDDPSPSDHPRNGTERNGKGYRKDVERNGTDGSGKTPSGFFGKISEKDLKTVAALMAWLRTSTDPALRFEDFDTRHRIVGAAIYAGTTKTVKKPIAAFVKLVQERHWNWITDDQMAAAKKRLVEWENSTRTVLPEVVNTANLLAVPSVN